MKTFVIVLLGVLVVVAGVLVPAMWFNLRDLRDADAAGVEAVAVAKKVAPDLLSYDYRSVEEDLVRAGAHTTGELTKHLKDLTTSLVAKAKAQKIVQTIAVAGAGVERAEPDRVEVLLFVNMSTVKEVSGEPKPRHEYFRNRARFVMVRQDSRWLVASLSTLVGTA
ncbi:hypothetical protein OHA25_00975 [Nonomuraea sp. NBC_00507]|uniref:hypothetical protein n=1 Tax=unclassified Nonomuraea TaxID=2593643 RepID=UPI00273B84B9|nr:MULTISPECIES: hypothetical protein [unclassified Nonomuraea]MDP4501454.1 hypothetical protein [Nonomuraea sp. G32]